MPIGADPPDRERPEVEEAVTEPRRRGKKRQPGKQREQEQGSGNDGVVALENDLDGSASHLAQRTMP